MKAKVFYLLSLLATFVYAPYVLAQTTAPDFSSLTDSMDFSSVITAVLLVMAALAGV